MSHSSDTLQDFVMGIIGDEAAKAAYLADPTGALAAAGLGDLTPADVAEVLPLVADSLPAGLPMDGADGVPMDGPAAALPGLDDLPVGLPMDGAAALGHLPGLDGLPVGVPDLPPLETPLGDVTGLVGDASATLDLENDVLSTSTSGYLSNPENGDAPTLSNYTSSALGEFAAGAKLDPSEFGGSIAGTTELADAGLGLVGHDNGSLGAWGGVDTVAGDLAGGVLVGPEGGALAAESPLGDLHLSSDGDFSITPADPADLLDVDNLGATGDAVAGTVANVLSTGADALADGAERGSDGLAGFLMDTPLAPAADVLETGVDTVTLGIQNEGDHLSEHLTALPTVDALPLDQLPELPALPDLPAIDSDTLPALPGAAGALPVDLPSLPVDLPDTSAVTGLVSDNAVTGAVQSSPVGGLLDGFSGHLPQVADLPGDLDLGL